MKKNEGLSRQEEILIGIYGQSLNIIHNWTLAINSGGVVAILTYTANEPERMTCAILWCLRIFSFGVISGVLWALINYCSVRIFQNSISNYRNTKDINKEYIQPAVLLCCQCFEDLLCAFSVICIILAFIIGLIVIH